MTAHAKADNLADGGSALCSRAVAAQSYGADGKETDIVWQLPEEVPVALQYNSVPFTVMMATPADFRDFAIGLSIAEGLIDDASVVAGVLVMPVDGGVTLDIAVAEGALHRERMGQRSIEGRSGCGLCGVEDIATANRPLPHIGRRWAPSADLIAQAAAALKDAQPMNQLNRSVHGAAFVDKAGKIVLSREDVGRHNALDKLIGATLRAGHDPKNGFVLMTSRCSYELVQKCVTAGFTGLVTVSAPTTRALDIAAGANLYLAALGPNRSVVVFNP